MSFLDYLDEHRGMFLDHRTGPPRPGIAIDDEAAVPPDPPPLRGGARARRRARHGARRIAFRHVRPAFSPSPYTDLLPYEEPWERAAR